MATRKYELMVILDPSRTEEQQTETLNAIDEVVTKYGGTPDRRDVWGKRRLAYPINRRRDGYYVVIYFDADSTSKVLAEVDRHGKFTEEIIRHVVTLAVVGKTAGNPALDREDRFQRPMGRPGDRRPPRRDEVSSPSAEGAPAVAVAEAPAAEGAPAEEAATEAAPAQEATPEAKPEAAPEGETK